MIQLSSAGKQFSSKILFEGLDWLVTPTDRVGLVGGNGTGKSTLLKVLARIEPLDKGFLSAAKGITTGYLPQDGLSLSGRTVLKECLSVFGDLLDIEKEMEALTHQMAEIDPQSEEYRRVADRYHRIETEFHGRDGYSLEAQANVVLHGLGFSPEDASRPTEELSGGWQMRVALAKLLLIKPNLLLLDEPTNHLDLEARNWLEQYLQDYPFAYVLVSHDRYFLDATVNKILEIWNRRAYVYSGNYERYLTQKSERSAQLEAAYRNQQERIRHLEIFINRFRYQATKAKQVQSRIKELEKIERIELPSEEKTIHFSFPQPPASGRMVAEFRGVAKSYGGKQVFQGVSFVINRRDRVGLVGVNGAGKSTLIKLLAGAETVTAGGCRLGHNVEVDYFAQDQYKALDPDARLIDDLASVAPVAVSGQTQLRTLLGCFLFSHDEVFKTIRVLSGGERNRYALLRMLLRPRNFLLLDEPTNHLDLRAKDVLLEALREFSGTVVFVSHDRYFIDKLATRIFEIEGGEFRDYAGNYEDYLWQKERRAPEPEDSVGDSQPAPEVAALEKRAEPATRTKKLNPILVREMQERRDGLEEEIARCEAEITTCEMDLASFKSAEESIRLIKLIDQNRTRLEEMMKEWEQIGLTLEEPGKAVLGDR
ncbi:MAG: ABC transporter ATP-binding protein [Acidobacteria bacterium RIFCSPLOWO2_12_FULL_60_22]|nr:MAG: ABC transporter ATP-binding protein [Acidobacteria bacterium RIFCSPLOWO2_12_FULL_60_22]